MIDVEGVFRVEHGDTGAPVLLALHGIGSAADAFVPQFPLADLAGRRLVAWDAPGYGRSFQPDEPFTLDHWADAAAALIDAEAGGRADVVGVSWGGVTATRLALRHPAMVRSLILADSSVGAGLTADMATAMRGRADAFDELGAEEFARSRTPVLVTEGAPADLTDEVARIMFEAVRQPTYGWACDSMADTDHRPHLTDITVPTLVVVGEHDRVTPPASSQVLADGIADARLVTIADAGHLANQEQPEAFNRAVADFLADVG